MTRLWPILLALSLCLTAFIASPASAQDPPAGYWQPSVASAAAERVLGVELADQIDFLSMTPGDDGSDRYRVWDRNGRVAVAGSTPAVALRGLNDYLGEHTDMSVSWNSHQVRADEVLPLPEMPLEVASNVAHRFALNDTDDGYSGPYRTFEDWAELLDVLAFHGFNEVFMPVGTEKVYYELLQLHGYSGTEALKWIPLPAHQPWWLLQNLFGVDSPMTLQLVEQRAELGREIADRTRELGMVPVLPGYYGSVPNDFSGRNGNVQVVGQGNWVGYTQPSWLDPTTPKFAEVAADFYELMDATLGASAAYKMDLLHEGGNAGPVNVTQAATGVQNALLAAHPDAIWVLLGWQGNPTLNLLNGTDKSKVFIVDGISDRYDPTANREAEWGNTPYAFGSIWNFGGHTTMGAWTDIWNEVFWNLLDKEGTAMNGIAMLPEGAYNNPFAMDELASLPWRQGPSRMTDVYEDWADRRYGAEDANARLAWQIIGSTAYTRPGPGYSEAQDSLFTAKPSLTVSRAADWSPGEMMYNARKFATALPALLAASPELRSTDTYAYDLMDVARQALANHSRELLPEIKAAFDGGHLEAFQELTGEWLEAMDLLDDIAGTNEQMLLGPWIEKARAMGETAQESDGLERDARSLLTHWGGTSQSLVDYANREWNGLLSSYYKPRWERFFAAHETALANGTTPATFDWRQEGIAWAGRTGESFDLIATGDVVEISEQILEFLDVQPLEPLTGGTHYLSDIRVRIDGAATNGWGPMEWDRSNGEQQAGDGGPLKIGGQLFVKGIGMHAPAKVSFDLGAQCESFSTYFGINDTQSNGGSVQFVVEADGEEVFRSETISNADGLQEIADLDITGVHRLTLEADPLEGNGNDHADWPEARVVCGDAGEDSVPPTVEDVTPPSDAQAGKVLSIQIVATGASATLTFAATGLPAGVSIDTVTGLISGVPTGGGTFNVTVTVADAAGNESEVAFTLEVTDEPPVSPSPKPSVEPSPEPSKSPSVTPAVTPSTPVVAPFVPTAPYTLAGTHTINDRQWFTECEEYSQTERCRTEIWATVVKIVDGQFVRESGWAFNNLTYLPYMTRAAWVGNPLGDLGSTTNGEFESAGRQWKTECDTAATGSDGCRSYTMTTVYKATAKPEGGYTFSQSNEWVFNNIVMFGGPEKRG